MVFSLRPCSSAAHNPLAATVSCAGTCGITYHGRSIAGLRPHGLPARRYIRLTKDPMVRWGHHGAIVGTWLTRSPNQVQPEDIVAQLPSFDRANGPGGSLRHLSFLATPYFAKLFEDGHPFLQNVANHIWGPMFAPGQQTIHLNHFRFTSAIVDRIPAPSREIQSSAALAAQSAPTQADGFEGVAFLLHSTSHAVDEKVTGTCEDEGDATIRFISFRKSTDATQEFQVARSLRLPPANTLFINGRKSTMFEDVWQLNPSPESSNFIQHLARRQLKTMDVFVPLTLEQFPRSIDLPLKSLTDLRIIATSMGNVVRELEDPSKGKPLPASSELEKVVLTFLNQARETSPDGNIQIYALVIPKANFALFKDLVKPLPNGSTVDATTSLSVSDIGDAIVKGARLHRVTGGGGGWGKQQGLLSIEPAIAFGSSDTHYESFFGDASAVTSTDLFAPGNAIQFFASYHVPRPSETEKHHLPVGEDVSNWDTAKWMGTEKLNFHLGVIPPLEDFVCQAPSAAETGPKLVCYPGHFGMFTESGACLETLQCTPEKRYFPITEMSPKFQSRIDVPYARFTALIPNSPPPSEAQIPPKKPLAASSTTGRKYITKEIGELGRRYRPDEVTGGLALDERRSHGIAKNPEVYEEILYDTNTRKLEIKDVYHLHLWRGGKNKSTMDSEGVVRDKPLEFDGASIAERITHVCMVNERRGKERRFRKVVNVRIRHVKK